MVKDGCGELPFPDNQPLLGGGTEAQSYLFLVSEPCLQALASLASEALAEWGRLYTPNTLSVMRVCDGIPVTRGSTVVSLLVVFERSRQRRTWEGVGSSSTQKASVISTTALTSLILVTLTQAQHSGPIHRTNQRHPKRPFEVHEKSATPS